MRKEEDGLSKQKIVKLLNELEKLLKKKEVCGEIYLVGGAVMCLAFHARLSTKDIDAVFSPKEIIRDSAKQIANKYALNEDWLNDAVKGFLSEKGDFEEFINLPYLKVFIARPEYLLAMKCLAMRLGAEYKDEQDVIFLLRILNITSYTKAVKIISQYYPVESFPQKTLYALEEICQNKTSQY